jgi:hypothetical protein
MIKQIEIKDSKYIYNSWEKFTTLTKQEEANLKEIVRSDKLFKRRKKILWITLK